MAGLASGERNDPSGEGRKSKPFLAAGGGIPQKYLGFQRLIFGLLVYAEIKRLGIKLAAKEEVKQKIKEMVAHDSPTGLSDLGLDLLNQYSSGGYDKLIKTRDVPPEKAHEFLRWYHGDFLAGLLKKKSFLISK